MTAGDIPRQYAPEVLKAERARGNTRTRADAPARPVDDSFWRDARVVTPPPHQPSAPPPHDAATPPPQARPDPADA